MENSAKYFDNLTLPPWINKQNLSESEWLDYDYIRTHKNRASQLIRTYVVDSDESAKSAGQRAANFIKNKTLYDFWPEDKADNYGLTEAEIAAAKATENRELDIEWCTARYAAKLTGTGLPKNETASLTEAGQEHSSVQNVAGQDEVTTSIETNKENKKPIRVGVIDVFGDKHKGIAINGVEKDFTHGELVSGALKSYLKGYNVEIEEYSVKTSDPKQYDNNGKLISQSGKSNLHTDKKSFLKELKKLNALPKDKKLDYLNISGIIQLEYKVNGRDITPEDLANPEIRAEIRAALPKSAENILQEIEKLISNGTEVYLSAGNRKNVFNAMSLAKGIHTIGGKNMETDQPLSFFTNNALVEEHVGLPLYLTGAKGGGQVMKDNNIKGVKMSGIIDQQSPLSKMSKWELSKKVATNADYAELKQYADKLIAEGKKKIDINFFQYSFAFTVPEKFRYKIYDTQRFIAMFEGHLEPEVIEYIKPMGTHCDIQYRQFFDMKAKEGQHVMPMSKTTAVRNTVSGTSFGPGQAIAQKIIENEK